MAMIISILALAAGIGSLICWIITLIKIFQSDGGIVHGIIGIICGLWAFIYGWMKVDEMANRQVMLLWTVFIIAGFVLNIFSAVVLGGGATP